MKARHGERLVDVTQYLLNHSRELVSLTDFAERYGFTKSSTSEDLGITKKTFKERGCGTLEIIPGAASDISFILEISHREAKKYIESLAEHLSEQDRLFPGGCVYLSDSLGESELLRQVGRITTSKYLGEKIDAAMAVAIRGIPTVQAVSHYLNAPFVIVCRNSKITGESTISANHASRSSERVEKMRLSKRGLEHGSRVLVMDGFMKGGGTVNEVESSIGGFESELVDITVFIEPKFNGHRVINDYMSPLYVRDVDTQTKNIVVVPGNYLSE